MTRYTCLLFAFCISIYSYAQSDTSARPAKMAEKFRIDSMEQAQAYFMRINHVKRMVEKGKDSKTVSEFDRYGNEISNKWYMDGELYSSTATSYNAFGDMITRTTTYFDDDGKPETIFITNSYYKIDPTGLTELCVKDESFDTYYRDGLVIKVNSVTTYTYDSKGQVTSTVETGKKGYCSEGPKSFKETIVYTYDAEGHILTEFTDMEGGCDGGESSSYTYTYDSVGRELKSVYKENGKLDYECTTEYDEQGREKRWISRGADGEVKFEFVFEYNGNGLKKSCTSIYKGDRDYESYNYDYY